MVTGSSPGPCTCSKLWYIIGFLFWLFGSVVRDRVRFEPVDWQQSYCNHGNMHYDGKLQAWESAIFKTGRNVKIFNICPKLTKINKTATFYDEIKKGFKGIILMPVIIQYNNQQILHKLNNKITSKNYRKQATTKQHRIHCIDERRW